MSSSTSNATHLSVSGSLSISSTGQWIDQANTLGILSVGGDISSTSSLQMPNTSLSMIGPWNQSILMDQSLSLTVRSFDENAKTAGNIQLLARNGVCSLQVVGDLSLFMTDSLNHFVDDGGNTIIVGGSVNLDGNSTAFRLKGSFVLTGQFASAVALRNNSSSQQAPVCVFEQLIFQPSSNNTVFQLHPLQANGVYRIRTLLQIANSSPQSFFGSILTYGNELQLGGDFQYLRNSQQIQFGTSSLTFHGSRLQSFSSSSVDPLLIGSLKITQGSTLQTLSSCRLRSGSWISVEAGATLQLLNANISAQSNAALNLYGTLSLTHANGCWSSFGQAGLDSASIMLYVGDSSIVEFGGGSQNLSGRTAFSSLNIFGSGTKTITTASLQIKKDLTISGSTTLQCNSAEIQLGGNISILAASNLNTSNSRLCFNGKTEQRIRSGNYLATNHLLFKGQKVTFQCDVEVSNGAVVTIESGEVETGTYVFRSSAIINNTQLVMSGGTLKIGEIPANGILLPRFGGTYTLTNGFVQLNGNGRQTLRGSMNYAQLRFSGSGIKSISSTIAQITQVVIEGKAELDVSNFTFGNATTSLTMADQAVFRVGGTGTKPDIGGTYTLGKETTIEFRGLAASPQYIRITPTYANVGVYGVNVQNAAVSTPLNIQAGCHFILDSLAKYSQTGNSSIVFGGSGGKVDIKGTFAFMDTDGWSGTLNTAISSANNPQIQWSKGSTLEFLSNATYRQLAPANCNVKLSGGATYIMQQSWKVNGDLGISNASSVQLNGYQLSVQGRISCSQSGRLQSNEQSSLVLFKGGELDFDSTMNKLKTLDNSDSVWIKSKVSIYQYVFARKGPIYSNSTLVFEADSSFHAVYRLDSSFGTIEGEVWAAMPIYGSDEAWKGFSSPFTNMQFQQLGSGLNVGIRGMNGSNLIFLNDLIYKHGGLHAIPVSQWRIAADTPVSASASNVIPQTRGFMFYVGSGGLYPKSTKVYVKGLLQQKSISSFSLKAGEKPYNGWNYLGNPYLTYLDWTQWHVEHSADVLPSLYVYHPKKRRYVSYIQGLNTEDPFNRSELHMIAPFQAFMTKSRSTNSVRFDPRQCRLSNAATFTLNRNAKASFFWLKMRDTIRNLEPSPLLAYHQQGATPCFSEDWDAISPNHSDRLACFWSDKSSLFSIKALDTANYDSLTLILRTDKPGVFELQLQSNDWNHAFLIDGITGKTIAEILPNYKSSGVFLKLDSGEHRCYLVRTLPSKDKASEKAHCTVNNGRIMWDGFSHQPTKVQLFDFQGRKINSFELKNHSLFWEIPSQLNTPLIVELSNLTQHCSLKVYRE
jgi:hypothetical protein